MSSAATADSAVGRPATARNLTDRGLAQALAAALWEAEPETLETLEPLPTVTPRLMDGDEASDGRPPAGRTEFALAPTPAAPEPDGWTARVDEMLRLQARQADHVEKLYAENRALREGEIAAVLAPVLLGLTKLADQMDLLAATEGPGGSAAMLRTQLLQVLQFSLGVVAFAPEEGELFDVTRERGVRAVETTEPGIAGRVAACVRPGFLRLDGSVVRVAEVEVYRDRAVSPPRGAGTARAGAAENKVGA